MTSGGGSNWYSITAIRQENINASDALPVMSGPNWEGGENVAYERASLAFPAPRHFHYMLRR